jgi:hypothetical protein
LARDSAYNIVVNGNFDILTWLEKIILSAVGVSKDDFFQQPEPAEAQRRLYRELLRLKTAT